MIYYGDRERSGSGESFLEALLATVSDARRESHAIIRRSHVARLLIDTGALCQGLLDREQTREDDLSVLSEAAARACAASGQLFLALQLGRTLDFDALTQALEQLRPLLPEASLVVRDPEGYAFYALYPELYLEAARAHLATLRAQGSPDVIVIGIRSIGTSLSAVAAAALESPHAPFSVRPRGPPFARELRVGPRLERALLHDHARRHYAVVDEGPGLSGSSFDAVTELLRSRGVQRAQITLFPSHDGEPGPEAGEPRRERYRQTSRVVMRYETYFDDSRVATSPARWFEDLTGVGMSAPRDLSAGRWRALHYADEASYPPSYARDERRKLLLESACGSWLLKFAGLGGSANELAARAQTLSEAGFTPRLLAVRHGFALTRFHHEAVPLTIARFERAQLVEHVARYLTFLVRHFVSAPDRGARPDALLLMLRKNTTQLLGEEQAEALLGFEQELPALQESARTFALDQKLDLHEWLLTPAGELLKCDAEDHHASHDWIGAQDPAWDLAGAAVELGFDAAELEHVCAALRDGAGYRVHPSKLRFYRLAYTAFRAARAHYGALALQGWADQDAERVRRDLSRYRSELASTLGT